MVNCYSKDHWHEHMEITGEPEIGEGARSPFLILTPSTLKERGA
jgi:hypothetical protein